MNQKDSDSPKGGRLWFWIAMTPLFVVVIVTVSMAIFAFRQADDRVIDDYYKQGRMINKRFEAEKAAMDLGVQGKINFDMASYEVFIDLDAKVLPKKLLLTFSHPMDSAEDQTISLVPGNSGGYRADLNRHYSGRWYLILSAEAGDTYPAWQVTLDIDFNRNSNASFSAHL